MQAINSNYLAEPEGYADLTKVILAHHPQKRVFCFYGEMGAGKTTFIHYFCKALMVTDAISSPTYTLVNEYQTNQGRPVYHFDFYRIEEESEALQIGIYEYLDSGNYCLIEWPEKILNLISNEYVSITISIEGNGRRISY